MKHILAPGESSLAFNEHDGVSRGLELLIALDWPYLLSVDSPNLSSSQRPMPIFLARHTTMMGQKICLQRLVWHSGFNGRTFDVTKLNRVIERKFIQDLILPVAVL